MSDPILCTEQNHLLAALPAAVFALLASHLELVAMPLGQLVYGPGRPLLHAYFPTHQEPYAHKLETLLRGAGIEVDAPEDADLDAKAQASRKSARLREAKKTMKRALEALVSVGFLKAYDPMDSARAKTS